MKFAIICCIFVVTNTIYLPKIGINQKAKELVDLFEERELSDEFIEKHCSIKNKSVDKLIKNEDFSKMQLNRIKDKQINTIIKCPNNRKIFVRLCKNSNNDLDFYITRDAFKIGTFKKINESLFRGDI